MVNQVERISHVYRRLGFGAQPDLVTATATTDEAIARALDLSTSPQAAPAIEPPADFDASRDRNQTQTVIAYWLDQLATSPRRIEERLVWFWHDHFATDIRKVKIAYLMHQQHLTIRRHATGSFAELLQAMSIDPAMLIYLDGAQNQSGARNENYGREVMELFTLGRGNYTEEDVVAASRSFTGWIVLRPGGRAEQVIDGDPWSAQFVRWRHDTGDKTLLGRSGPLDTPAAIEVLLEQKQTARFVGGKLFNDLVGWWPDEPTTDRIAAAFRADYQIMDLVSAIVAEPAFLSDDAILAKVRSPLEKAVGLVQAIGSDGRAWRGLGETLRTMAYVPFVPPNVAGFPKGNRLLDPHRLIHTFDFSSIIPPDLPEYSPTEVMNRLGIFEISPATRRVLAGVAGAGRMVLAVNSPEYHLV
jgi:uncharacterized protein (DUF1800 family)